jgi:hypothetical protein
MNASDAAHAELSLRRFPPAASTLNPGTFCHQVPQVHSSGQMGAPCSNIVSNALPSLCLSTSETSASYRVTGVLGALIVHSGITLWFVLVALFLVPPVLLMGSAYLCHGPVASLLG